MHENGSLEEEHYDLERAHERTWDRTKRITKFHSGALGPILGTPRSSNLLRPSILKAAPPELFHRSENNLEMRWEAMQEHGYLVPKELFFVRNNSPAIPLLDPSTWRLEVTGNGVARPRTLSYDEILAMPSRTLIRAIECAGNGRNFFAASHGRKIEGTPWNLGAIGVAEWTGVPLREVLEQCGVRNSARDVMPEGLDEGRVKRPIPLRKAMDEDTLLAYAMNGEALLPDHGFPVRMVVPGWVGIAHIKWVGSIEVSEQPLYSEYNTTKYILIGDEYAAVPPFKGQVLTTNKVKSAFELPWEGKLAAGPRTLRGRSWSGEGRIERVDVSLDGGGTWRAARLLEPNYDLAWVRWEIEWDARPGVWELQARATDDRGNTQPDRIPMNQEGYAHWAVVTHPVTVI